MVKKSLNIIQKKNRKNFYDEIPKKKAVSPSSNILILSAGSNGNGQLSEEEQVEQVVNDTSKTDTQKQNSMSEVKSSYETTSSVHNMEQYISDMITSLTQTSTADTSVNNASTNQNNAGTTAGDINNEVSASASSTVAWDPRLGIVDYFKSSNDYIIPFASVTASSAFFDEVFTIEKGAYETAGGSSTSTSSATDTKSGQSSSTSSSSDAKIDNTNAQSGDKVPTNPTQVNTLKNDPNSYGTQSLMNPYCVTKLVGGLSKGSGESSNFTTHMYDVRDTKRFYDNAANVLGESIVSVSSDVTSINNPTTTNIITWSNKDKWGRTPYSFQDFVFCKYWNVIPNNRLITFRKYAVPTYDNLNFPNMVNDDGSSANEQNTAAPIATVVTYFGGDSANKLNDFLKFTTGTKWKDITADIHKVQGDNGSNPRAVIDKMFESGGFGGQGSASPIVNAFLNKTGGLSGQYLSFGKFVGLLDPNGYNGHSQNAWENLTTENMDPMDNLYSNKIIGPVNRIQSVKARDAGIEFGQSFTLTCEYVARPIGGINTKAAMLDIMSNCMEIASPEAVFWGGGHRFMIKPHMYPFRGTSTRNKIMDELYKGNIFGTKGAIAAGLQGFLDFGRKDDGTGSFNWSTVTERLGDILGQTVGAIGNMLQSISSSLFGESSTLSSWIKTGTDALTSEENQQKGTAALNSMFSNINKMWHDKVIQETMMPNIQGMKAILSGEPTGNWHLTLGNPLNPIMVVGNLICTKMEVNFGDELGPDDFPLEMKVVYTIEHAMARDKAAIQSMFNRGAGKIYKLPDYVKALSDYETSVDPFTGGENVRSSSGWTTPEFMKAGTVMALGSAVNGYTTSGYQTYKLSASKTASNTGNADTTVIAKFTPIDPDVAHQTVGSNAGWFLSSESNRAVYKGNLFARKRTNN